MLSVLSYLSNSQQESKERNFPKNLEYSLESELHMVYLVTRHCLSCVHIFTRSPNGCDETLDGVWHGARVTGQNRPSGRVFGVDDQWACSLQQVGGAVKHGACRVKDGLLCGRALQKNKWGTNVELFGSIPTFFFFFLLLILSIYLYRNICSWIVQTEIFT